MLLLNTYPSEVCSQLMSMYQRMVSHATQNVDEPTSNGDHHNGHAEMPADEQQPSTTSAMDAITPTRTDDDDALPSTSHTTAQRQLVEAEHVHGWRMCFGSVAAEARFARWLAMHSVHGDVLGVRNTLILSLVLQLIMCIRSSKLDHGFIPVQLESICSSRHALAVGVWVAIVGTISAALISLTMYRSHWYKAHREQICAAYRVVLVTAALAHSIWFWAPAAHISSLLTCFLALTTAYPAVQLAVRWQYHTLLQLLELILLLVSAPFLFQWHSPWGSHDNAEVLIVMLVFVFFGCVLPSLLLHSGERRLRFLFAEAQARTAA